MKNQNKKQQIIYNYNKKKKYNNKINNQINNYSKQFRLKAKILIFHKIRSIIKIN